MTDTEFAQRMTQVGIARGRIQVARELAEWVTQHPSILISQAADDLAKDFLVKCHQIVLQARP